jgi:hypothetical protein
MLTKCLILERCTPDELLALRDAGFDDAAAAIDVKLGLWADALYASTFRKDPPLTPRPQPRIDSVAASFSNQVCALSDSRRLSKV